MTPMATPRQIGASGPSAAAELGRALLHEADHALLEVLGAEELHRLQQHVVAVAGEVLGLTVAAQALHGPDRSEERRVGKECVCTCRSRGSPYHSQQKI